MVSLTSGLYHCQYWIHLLPVWCSWRLARIIWYSASRGALASSVHEDFHARLYGGIMFPFILFPPLLLSSFPSHSRTPPCWLLSYVIPHLSTIRWNKASSTLCSSNTYLMYPSPIMFGYKPNTLSNTCRGRCWKSVGNNKRRKFQQSLSLTNNEYHDIVMVFLSQKYDPGRKRRWRFHGRRKIMFVVVGGGGGKYCHHMTMDDEWYQFDNASPLSLWVWLWCGIRIVIPNTARNVWEWRWRWW